jgi:uncharacterized RDD family membrane protein YckC
VKCPKCNYLGFETGDTCKNCGYDFSLIADESADPIDFDLDLQTVDTDLALVPDWPEAVDGALADTDPVLRIEDDLGEFAPQPELEPAERAEPPMRFAARESEPPPLPLFTPSFSDDDDDEPLIKLPAAPRPPLAVRRTPDTPRLRVVPKPMRSAEAAPALAFDEEVEAEPFLDIEEAEPPAPIDPPHRASRVWASPQDPVAGAISPPGVRLAAAAIDHLLLGGVDVVVIYFTMRIAGLAMGAWTTLPPAPMFAFLLLLKFAYFAAFTAVGGQTIGKMTLRLRVVAADRTPVDGAGAIKRTLAGTVSALTLGLGYLPAFFDGERRTLHDRLARTRVVALP